MLTTIAADIRANVNRELPRTWPRMMGKLLLAPTVHVVVMYRIGAFLYRWRITRPLAFILRSFSIIWGSTEIHPGAQIGPGLCLVHSMKVVIGNGAVLGEGVRIGQGVTISGDAGRGARNPLRGCPVIGDHVTIGIDAIVMGNVTVGDHSVIGAQALVIHDVPAWCVATGSPARVVRRLNESPEGGNADQSPPIAGQPA
ncbi:MAG TPA: serine O-acetyltransferase [Aeromicrobium sp.]|nr:serine O-acetyltransferase [Aeromicrobium sp.]